MAMDPVELMSPRERLAHNINMRARAADGGAAPPPSAHATAAGDNFFGQDGLDFEDFLDMINPLQHLPLVSIAYREITGDEISAGARIVGDGLYGGPAGVFLGAMNAAMAEANDGKDLGAFALNSIKGDEPVSSEAVVAANTDAAALGEVAPAAGEIEVAAVATPWVDPDKLPPEPAAIAPAAGGDPAAPRRIVPEAMQSGPEAKAAPMPELSEDQVALLLSSVGIADKTKSVPATAVPAAATSAAPAPAAEPDEIERAVVATPIKRSAQRAAAPHSDETPRVGLGPMKQTYIRAPAGAKYAPHTPITEDMRSHMSRPTVPASSADPAWISDAMAAALNKYRNGKILEQDGNVKGSTIDGSF